MSSTATTVRRYANYVNGRDREGHNGATFESINPTTGAAFGRFVESSANDVDAAVRAAHAAFEGPWRALSPTRRGRLMMRWGDLITENAEQIATIETEQNGKLFAEMRTQARIVQDWLYYFGGGWPTRSRAGWFRSIAPAFSTTRSRSHLAWSRPSCRGIRRRFSPS